MLMGFCWHQVSLDDLLSMISQARKVLTNIGVTIPVTTAEIWPLLAEGAGSIIAQASDFICMQIQPFWEGRPVDCGGKGNCIDAAQYVIGKAAEIEALLGKKVVICETGWPTAGEKCCGTRPYSLQGFQVCSHICTIFKCYAFNLSACWCSQCSVKCAAVFHHK